MAEGTTTTATIKPSARGAVPPLGLFIVGVIALLFWAWGNLVQIQTSEAFLLGGGNISLVPNLHVLNQPFDFFHGTLSPDLMKAATWAWGLEGLLLVVSIGVEYSHIVQKHARWFNTGAIILLVLNSIADYQYGSVQTGFWGQVAFAAMTLFMSFFMGLVGIHLIWSSFSGAKH
jgi:hypothetical protein